jgi:hypothetical protein
VSASVRSRCVTCGPVDVRAVETVLLVGGADDGVGNQLEFTCPRCHELRTQDADERATRLLSGAGVVLAVRAQPAVADVLDDADEDQPAT